jgi:acetyltransferase
MGQFAALPPESTPSIEHDIVPGFGVVRIRPLSLADWEAYRAFGQRIERDDLRLRFAGPVKLDDSRCHRLLDVDHDHEEAFGAFDQTGALLGVGRVAGVEAGEAEIALIVRSDLKRRGIGTLLLDRLLRYGDQVGLSALRADVLYENRPMLYLAQRAGFRFVSDGGLMLSLRRELRGSPTGMFSEDAYSESSGRPS